ncbi:hypothetical protein AMTRI_Chr04g183060 [Amborella trichopoda]
MRKWLTRLTPMEKIYLPEMSVFCRKMRTDFYVYLTQLKDDYQLDNNKRPTDEAQLFYQRTLVKLLYSHCFLFTVFFVFIMFILFYKNYAKGHFLCFHHVYVVL